MTSAAGHRRASAYLRATCFRTFATACGCWSRAPASRPSPCCRWRSASARTPPSSAWSTPRCCGRSRSTTPDRLVSVFMTDQRNPGNLPLSHLNYKDLRDQNQVFTDMAALSFSQVNWRHGTGVGADPGAGRVRQLLLAARRASRRRAAASCPRRTRKPTPVAVVSHGFWERSLGCDPAIVGKTLTLNRTPFTDRRRRAEGLHRHAARRRAVGAGCRCRCTTSSQPDFDWYEQRRGLFLFAFGRLKPGVTVEQAAREPAHASSPSLEQAYPDRQQGAKRRRRAAARRRA